MKHGKHYRAARGLVDRDQIYDLESALTTLASFPKAKFDETVDVAVRLNVNPRHADQMVRGTVVLPHGTGKQVRVLVITRGPKEAEAAAAGADMVGADEYIPKIKEGWTDVDVIIATPDMMGDLGTLGQILGPRGLMPNPKVGTVSADVAQAVKNAKAGQVQYRTDKAGIVHCTIGQASFEVDALKTNLMALIEALNRAKPQSSKGVYLRKVAVSTTMGPGIRVDQSSILAAA